MADKTGQLPIQPVKRPILCSPYEMPDAHWLNDTKTGEPKENPGRRDADYWYGPTRWVALRQSCSLKKSAMT